MQEFPRADSLWIIPHNIVLNVSREELYPSSEQCIPYQMKIFDYRAIVMFFSPDPPEIDGVHEKGGVCRSAICCPNERGE